MYRQFNIQQFYVLPTQLYLCVLCGSENKQRLFPYTTLTDWFYKRDAVCLLRGTDWIFTYNYRLRFAYNEIQIHYYQNPFSSWNLSPFARCSFTRYPQLHILYIPHWRHRKAYSPIRLPLQLLHWPLQAHGCQATKISVRYLTPLICSLDVTFSNLGLEDSQSWLSW